MQIRVAVNLTLNRNVRIILRQPEVEVDNEDEDDGVGDDETYTVDSYSDNSFASDSSLFVLDDVESALHEYVESESAQGASFGWVLLVCLYFIGQINLCKLCVSVCVYITCNTHAVFFFTTWFYIICHSL